MVAEKCGTMANKYSSHKRGGIDSTRSTLVISTKNVVI
jgi:hypothetical protein